MPRSTASGSRGRQCRQRRGCRRASWPSAFTCSASTAGAAHAAHEHLVHQGVQVRQVAVPVEGRGGRDARRLRFWVRRTSSAALGLRKFQIRPSSVPSGWQEAQATAAPELAWKMAWPVSSREVARERAPSRCRSEPAPWPARASAPAGGRAGRRPTAVASPRAGALRSGRAARRRPRRPGAPPPGPARVPGFGRGDWCRCNPELPLPAGCPRSAGRAAGARFVSRLAGRVTRDAAAAVAARWPGRPPA